MRHEESQLLIPAYVLGTADDAQQRAVEQHALGCDECRAEIRQMQATVGDLARGTAAAGPRPELRDSILAAARAESEAAVDATPPSTNDAADVSRRPRRWNSRRLLSWSSPALAAACLVLGVLVADLRSQTDELRSDLAAATTGEAEEPADGATVAGGPITASTLVTGTSHGRLKATTVNVALSDEGGMVMLRDLPEPPDGHVWQGWAVHDTGATENLATVVHGGVVVMLPIKHLADGAVAIALTLEPGAGSEVPTTDPLATADLQT